MAKISKRGTSQGVNIPKDYLTVAGLEVGDKVVIEAKKGVVTIKKVEK